MGIIRFIKRSTITGRTIDTVKNIMEEGSLFNGLKRTIKEDFTEDNPIGKLIYESGKYDGEKEGYIAASDEYEKKLSEQAKQFLKQKKVFENERDSYEKLLDEYDAEIQRLTNLVRKTEAEKALLQKLILEERRLKNLAVV